jgi:hypothetical protein
MDFEEVECIRAGKIKLISDGKKILVNESPLKSEKFIHQLSNSQLLQKGQTA